MYNPNDWYWFASDGRLYSSNRQSIINADDEQLKLWQEAGNSSTPWPKDDNGIESDAALADVLAAHGLSLYPQNLEDAKSSMKRQIDKQAETERLKYITDGVGQSMTYQEKVNQAANFTKAWLEYLREAANDTDTVKATPPSEAEYLLLKSSLGIDGDTLDEVARNVTWAYALWEQIGAEIETIRLQTKALIDACETSEEAQAIFDAVKWP